MINITTEEVRIYARVSDIKLKKDGERRQDVDRQVEKLTAFAERAGWKVIKVYKDDGISAYKDDYSSRPAFSQMMKDIKAHYAKRILVEDMTRWYRRLEEGLRTLRVASDFNCTITSTQEGEIEATLQDKEEDGKNETKEKERA